MESDILLLREFRINKIVIFLNVLEKKTLIYLLSHYPFSIQTVKNSEGARGMLKHGPYYFVITVATRTSQLFLINSQKTPVGKGNS